MVESTENEETLQALKKVQADVEELKKSRKKSPLVYGIFRIIAGILIFLSSGLSMTVSDTKLEDALWAFGGLFFIGWGIYTCYASIQAKKTSG